ncbi:putative protein phosphatase 2C 39 isoform X4 [Senna tora]|uniref:PPM-type phosphatase domain-containing protein n=1 Tax=Senna tora TaxID=362788 RepID=A0A834XDD0_9FABA|nr:putative protein phosphatase 2C 39 isoform X4 [Senna tora]
MGAVRTLLKKQREMGSSSSHKRKYLKIDVNPPTSKSKRCSLEETSLDKFKSKRCNNNLEETSMDKLKAGFWKNPVRAVKRACKATDDEILEKVADWRGGSTAVAAILINGVKLLVANVGDSRAISCINGIPRQITIDHDPHREKHLVQSRGGFVSKRPGCAPRVDDQLAMSRAFGDGKLKEHITAEPDVMVHKIDDHTDFIILASDGLWKVMTNEEACDCIKDIDDAKKASKKLVKEALRKGSYDDISCIVVMF